MNIKNHTRNQKRMYRIHKQEEKIMEQELMIGSLKQEIERLNNIINELEKWLREKQELTCGCGITADYLYAYENCLDKLKELKEGNK